MVFFQAMLVGVATFSDNGEKPVLISASAGWMAGITSGNEEKVEQRGAGAGECQNSDLEK